MPQLYQKEDDQDEQEQQRANLSTTFHSTTILSPMKKPSTTVFHGASSHNSAFKRTKILESI
jgi:hypothetical protein